MSDTHIGDTIVSDPTELHPALKSAMRGKSKTVRSSKITRTSTPRGVGSSSSKKASAAFCAPFRPGAHLHSHSDAFAGETFGQGKVPSWIRPRNSWMLSLCPQMLSLWSLI